MSDKRRDDGGEPSMEEILASIRKIISEDTEGQSGGGQDSGGKGGQTARQDAGLQLAELAAELDLDEKQLLAIEQGRATRANVGGSAIRALEERLDVTLVDE